MQHDLVPDRHALAHDEFDAFICVQDGTVLNVAALADDEPVVVATQHTIEPDTCLVPQAHAANDRCVVGNEMTRPLEFRGAVTERVYHLALPCAATAAAAFAIASGSPRNSREIGLRSSSSS